MLFSRYFKQPKPNKFGYTAVFYDEKKEKRENRIASIEKEMGMNKDNDAPNFDSEDFRERFANRISKTRKPQRKGLLSNIGSTGSKKTTRIVLLAIMAGVILYWQFKG